MMLNNKEYTSKASVTRYVRENILNVYPHRHELSQDHFKFMIDLLNYHPSKDRKIGVGIKKIWVQRNKYDTANEFWLERLDGSITDFSYLQCLTASTNLKKVKQAMRASIDPIVSDYRKNHFAQYAKDDACICPVLGRSITIYESHVDHIAPDTFDCIANEFIHSAIDIADPPITKNVDGLCGVLFTDKVLEEKWITYHNQRAKLRVISASANLGLCRRRGIAT